MAAKPNLKRVSRFLVSFGERSPRAMPDVQYIYDAVASVHRINNSVGVWAHSKKQLSKLLLSFATAPRMGNRSKL
jgi:hypothetical protein